MIARGYCGECGEAGSCLGFRPALGRRRCRSHAVPIADAMVPADGGLRVFSRHRTERGGYPDNRTLSRRFGGFSRSVFPGRLTVADGRHDIHPRRRRTRVMMSDAKRSRSRVRATGHPVFPGRLPGTDRRTERPPARHRMCVPELRTKLRAAALADRSRSLCGKTVLLIWRHFKGVATGGRRTRRSHREPTTSARTCVRPHGSTRHRCLATPGQVPGEQGAVDRGLCGRARVDRDRPPPTVRPTRRARSLDARSAAWRISSRTRSWMTAARRTRRSSSGDQRWSRERNGGAEPSTRRASGPPVGLLHRPVSRVVTV